MNLIKIFSLNRHGDYREILFSSSLSYLLDPKENKNLGDSLIKSLYREIGVPIEALETYRVTPEVKLDDKGNVDIFIEPTTSASSMPVIAVEAKIWDRSARNEDASGIAQLIRYADVLSAKWKDKWRLVFLVPTVDSPICIEEFNIVRQKYPENIYFCSWNQFDVLPGTLPRDRVMKKSMCELLEIARQEIRDTPGNDRTLWILDSLIEILPEIIEEVPDPGRFPTMADLKAIAGYWAIFEPFQRVARPRPISSQHTTVGISSAVRGRALYRIRTTRSYYRDASVKQANLPGACVEIELWPQTVARHGADIRTWLRANGLPEVLDAATHLDDGNIEPIHLIRITHPVPDAAVVEFNRILRQA